MVRWLLHPSARLSQRALHATLWTFGARGLERTLGYARVIALARLLSPVDFGLMGVGLIIIAALESLTQPGFREALVQRKGDINEYLDTFWTVKVTRAVVIAGAMALGAPFIANFFESPDARLVIQALAGAVLLSGFTNPGLVYFQKNLEIQKQTVVDTTLILAEMITAIVAAVILRNVWALVLGYLARNIAWVVVSYLVHPYRPRLIRRPNQARELFAFGRWVYLDRIVTFVSNQADSLMLVKLLGSTTLGFYQMAQRTSMVPLMEIPHGLSLVTFPVYSKLQDNLPKLRETYLRTLEGITSLILPLAIAIMVLGHDFVALVLGEKWLPAVAAIQILAIAAFVRSLTTIGGSLFVGVGQPWLRFQMNLLRAVVVAAAVFPLTWYFGLSGAAYAVLIATTASSTFVMYHAFRTLRLGIDDVVRALLPGAGVAATIGLVEFGAQRLLEPVDLPRFLAMLALAGVTYAAIYLLLWWKLKVGVLSSLIGLRR